MVVSQMTAPVAPPSLSGLSQARLAEFELLYRSRATSVTAFFARRTRDPQLVADLTADTFAEAMGSFASFDPARGTAGPWLFAIARHVYAKHCEGTARRSAAVERHGARRVLDAEEIDELLCRIDAEAPGRELIAALERLPRIDRAAVELVDLVGLTPREAARSLGVSSGALRVRLSRARARLRKECGTDVQVRG
jgi:RNA polymerase sigma factor (sigma-70 family)